MTEQNTLLEKAVRAAIWGYAGTAIRLVMQLGVQVLLARLLGPAQYGLFALGVIVLSFAQFFGDVASSALIQRKAIDDNQIRFAYTWQLIVSIAVSSLVFLGGDLIAAYTREPAGAAVIQVLALVCVLNALGGVSLALLRRELKYREIQIAQVLGYFVGYVLVGLSAALLWQPSVWALVAAWLTQVAVTSLLLMRANPHSVRPKFFCAAGGELVRFGWHSLVSNLGTWAMSNIDRVIVARYFPAIQVGLYTTSANLLATPLSQLYATFQSVAFSASSRLGDDSGQIANTFSTVLIVVVLFAGLVYGTSFVAADLIVLTLYGEDWIDAVPFVKVFSFVMFCNALSGSISPLLWGRGKIGSDARLQAFVAILLVTGSLLCISYSAVAVAIWVAVCMAFRSTVLLGLAWQNFLGRSFIGLFPAFKMFLFVSFFVISFALIRYALSDVDSLTLDFALLGVFPLLALVVVFNSRNRFGVPFSKLVNSMAIRLPLIGRYLV